LISADYSAIQAVVLAAMAGEQWRLDVFATHGKIYERTASDLSGVPFEDMLKHREETGKHHPLRQTLGKVAELSGGFAAWVNGWKKFGAAEIIGSDAEIKKAILKWRAASPMIVELWGGQTRNKFQYDERPELYGLEGAAISAVLHPGQAFHYRGIAYQMHGDCLYCRPPSGGYIRYHAPRLESARSRPYASPWELDLSYEGWSTSTTKGSGRPGWQRMKLYGGVLTQNVISHCSREVMVYGMLRLEAAGYPVIAHTHDELISEVENGHGSLAEFERLILPIEPWACTPDGKRWPIKSSGWIGQRNGAWE
jgi:DNA polymerase